MEAKKEGEKIRRERREERRKEDLMKLIIINTSKTNDEWKNRQGGVCWSEDRRKLWKGGVLETQRRKKGER